ncbi:hypothetical protein N9U10_00825 [Candidatus Pelagibacter sp.]|nr:hypothetical protein [Candidatus Pelagibacter sp.]
MICFKANIPKEITDINDKLKVIYHSKNAVCFFIFENREQRNEFVERTKRIAKVEQETIYQEYQS